MHGLDPALRERVLAKLGFPAPPLPDRAGLAALYASWCQRVPFDNLRKLLHVRSGDPGPLPGDTPADFFAAWLAHGTGGTCWAGNGALCALLESLGFAARRGIATMLVAPDLSPNHGTVSVRLDGATWLVDASLLHGAPLRLDPAHETEVPHPAWGARARPDGGRWLVRWRPQHRPEGLDCRIDALDGSAADFAALHEATRGWSPFNYSLYLRVQRGGRVIGAAFGQRVEIDERGAVAQQALDPHERRRLLEEAGISAAVAAALPDDRPLPPPPGVAPSP
jgi:arylamine N-acetyltransferase